MERAVVVRTEEGGRLRNRVAVGGHEVVSDAGSGSGGGDAGPTPFELLLGALGSCTAMTLRMYAARKSWDLRAVEVVLAHEPVEAETGPKFRVRRIVRLTGSLDADQRARLGEIADRCPVHRALTGGVLMESRME